MVLYVRTLIMDKQTANFIYYFAFIAKIILDWAFFYYKVFLVIK